jgi:hypothetical protein
MKQQSILAGLAIFLAVVILTVRAVGFFVSHVWRGFTRFHYW